MNRLCPCEVAVEKATIPLTPNWPSEVERWLEDGWSCIVTALALQGPIRGAGPLVFSTAGGRDLDPHAAKYSTSRTARSGGFSPERETATGQGVVTDTNVARKGASPLHCHITFFVEHPSISQQIICFQCLNPCH